jgi:hypothetical protein
MGGLRVTPDIVVDELDPAASGVLILPGSEMGDTGDSSTPVSPSPRSAAPPWRNVGV